MMQQQVDLAALFMRIPQGWSRREYQGRHYGVTRTVSAGGRIQKIFAHQLGGTDIVSANLYPGDRFRPCEMPGEQVVAFLAGSAAAPAPAVDRFATGRRRRRLAP